MAEVLRPDPELAAFMAFLFVTARTEAKLDGLRDLSPPPRLPAPAS